jgi:hypothetical protein
VLRFDRYGPPEGPQIEEPPDPSPAVGQAEVRMRASASVPGAKAPLKADSADPFDLKIEGFSPLASVLRLAEDSLFGRTHPVVGRELFAFGPE